MAQMTAKRNELIDRVRWRLAATEHDVVERKMFRGTCFMVNGKMCVCVSRDELMCRISPEDFAEAIEMNGCRPMVHGDRMMTGFVFVGPEAYEADAEFEEWMRRALEFNRVARPSRRRVKRN